MKKLEEQRKMIDFLDESIINFLAERDKVVKQIDKIKKVMGKKPLDTKRKNEMLSTRQKIAKARKIDPKYIKKIFQLIHDHSLSLQKNDK